MRLASREVKALLARGQFMSATEGDTHLAARSLKANSSQPAEKAPRAAIAFSVPKRALKRAVDRNRVKRALKEVFRNHDIAVVDVNLLVTFGWAAGRTDRVAFRGASLSKATAANARELFTKLARKLGGR